MAVEASEYENDVPYNAYERPAYGLIEHKEHDASFEWRIDNNGEFYGHGSFSTNLRRSDFAQSRNFGMIEDGRVGGR